VRTELREYELPVAVGDQAPLSEADVAALEEEEEEGGAAPPPPPGSVGGAGSMAAVAAPVEVEGGRGMRYQAGGGNDAMPDELMPEEVQEGGGPEDDDRDIILTSDQKVLLISLRKERVMSALQTLMKTVSVDCKLNFEDNNDGSFKCLDLGDNIGSFAYHPDLQKDIVETSAAFKVQGTAAGPKVQGTAAGPKVQDKVAAPKVQEAEVAAGPAGGAGSAAAVAAPVPVPVVPKGPALKKINYRGTEYRYSYKLNAATGLPFGYIFYQINDLSGEGEPVGYTGVSKKGLPSGDISTTKPEWA
jgi:hypothetical protein